MPRGLVNPRRQVPPWSLRVVVDYENHFSYLFAGSTSWNAAYRGGSRT